MIDLDLEDATLEGWTVSIMLMLKEQFLEQGHHIVGGMSNFGECIPCSFAD